MLVKNEVALSSTLHSPSSLPPLSPQAHLTYKSSISNTSQSDDAQLPHPYSLSSFNRNPNHSQFSITLIIRQTTYDIECHSVSAFQRQLQKIFSVCGLNRTTKTSLKMLLVNKIMHFNPSFYQLLTETVQQYQNEQWSSMLTANK